MNGDAAVAALVAARVTGLRAAPLGMPIGCQTWPVRTLIAKDFPGTIKLLADAGFEAIELCSPVGYASSGFADVAKITLFLTDVGDRAAINPVRQEFFGESRPASTLVEVPALAIPGAKIEIEAVAVLQV